MEDFQRKSFLFLFSLILAGCLFVGAYKLYQPSAELPEINVEISADGLSVSKEALAGIVAVNFRNTSKSIQSPGLLRLNDGVTNQEFYAAFSKGPQASLPLISLLGGQNLLPGESVRIIWDLSAGTYLVVNFSDDPTTMAILEVLPNEKSQARAPKPDVRVDLQDYMFDMPMSVDAGIQTWEIINSGEQWHDVSIIKLKEGMTGFDLLVALSSGDPVKAQPVYEEKFFWAAISRGERAWVTVDLEPGSYIVLCDLPDFGDGLSHFHKGMVSKLEVR